MTDSPEIFISSPYETYEFLRRTLAETLISAGYNTWIAEGTGDQLPSVVPNQLEQDDISISDTCLDALSRCNAVICVLGNHLGSPIRDHDMYYRAKHFELEVFSALTQNKPLLILRFQEFNPLAESQIFVHALTRSKTSFRVVRDNEDAVNEALKFSEKFRPTAIKTLRKPTPIIARKIFVSHLAGNRRHIETNHQFPFWGQDKDKVTSVNLSLANRLISDSEVETNNHIRFGRLWMALREIRGQSFNESCQPESAETWDNLLANWRKVSSFYGVHGHLYTGALAASTGLAKIRSITGLGPYPFNNIMSAKFSIVKDYTNVAVRFASFLSLYRHIGTHLSLTDDLADSHIIMGSIQFRLLNLPLAHFHFKRALAIREKEGDSYQTGYSQLHVAQTTALMFWKRREAVELAFEAMEKLVGIGHMGQQKRHLQKVAKIMHWAGQEELARNYQEIANKLEGSDTYLDQNKIKLIFRS